MLKLSIIRPNTIGTTLAKEFDDYGSAEDYIERRVEKLADSGWNVTELKGSTSQEGCIECVHDDVADILLIQWETVA